VLAGHAIGEIARASEEELARRLELRPALPPPSLGPILDALERLDGWEAAHLLGLQLSALGARAFAQRVAAPLLCEIGSRWASGTRCVAAEHLASATLRSLLGAALRPRRDARSAPILFTTMPGELHELGPVMAAIASAEAGGAALFAGANLPIDEIVDAAARIGAAAVGVGICYDDGGASESLAALRRKLPRAVEVWIGGNGAAEVTIPANVAPIRDFDELERKVTLLAERKGLA
jgi:hypothetical protein